MTLTNRAFHLKLNKSIQLNGIFHWQFFDKRLNETINNHGTSFCFRKPANGSQFETAVQSAAKGFAYGSCFSTLDFKTTDNVCRIGP